MSRLLFVTAFCVLLVSCWTVNAQSEDSSRNVNPYAYLDEYCDAYYPGTAFPKLVTQQWVGEAGVDAVVTLGIDDMRDTAKYEAYLRPLLDELKKLDGRAPVSIMTCKVDPNDPQLQSWLKEGLSIETHTADHPCPCLQGGDFAKAKATYDKCVDTMFAIPNSSPVAFRFPCMDSKNTPSPRAFAEIVNKTTASGNFLQASTSVVCVFNSSDPELPRSLTLNDDGGEKFERYIPFPSFVNKIENYPYPYVIGKLCWEFPCTIPDDWQAQNIQQPNNPRTVDDMVAAIDATVIKRGIANIIFHPHNWIRSDQMATVVRRVNKTHGGKVKFLTFRECIDRINQNLLLGQPLRAANGGDNGVRILDLNQDGFLDVIIGNENLKVARLWQPQTSTWHDIPHDIQFTAASDKGRADLGVRIGQLRGERVGFFVNHEQDQAIYEFESSQFNKTSLPDSLREIRTSVSGVDQGVRMRDVDGDGASEIVVGNQNRRGVFKHVDDQWTKSIELPFAIVDDKGRDNGTRFVDFDGDQHDDMIVANGSQTAIRLFDESTGAFSREVKGLSNVPPIVRDGTNNGVWFAANHMWLQNEDTNRMPDGVDRRSFAQLLGDTDPAPRAPADSLNCIQVGDQYTVELVAAEPMVMDPVALDWGPDGKLWVVEMADYPLGVDDNGTPGGRVRYLEDTDGDGKYDKSTLFMDEIAYPTGVIAWRDGVIVSAAPTVFFAADRDDDGRADFREDLYRGFTQGNQQHLVNGFERGLDNWLYLANGDSGGVVESVKTGKKVDIRGLDLRVRPEDGSLEVQTGRAQFGRHRDDHGNWFGCSNPLPLKHYVLADHYLRRNKHIASGIASNNIARVDNTQVFPISRILSHWSGYKPPAPGTGHKFTSACSTMVYRDELFGREFQDNTFTCEPVHNLVHRRKLIPKGVTFESERPKGESDVEFLASSDSWFRPATVTTGPDGAIWIVDMYRLVIEHPEWIDDTEEKRLFLRAGHDRGRIYRVYPAGKEPRTIEKLGELSNRKLVETLNSTSGRLRDAAQSLLIERAIERKNHDPSQLVAHLTELAKQSSSPLGRLHALCTLDGIAQRNAEPINVETLLTALADKDATVVRHAIRIAEAVIAGQDANADRVLAALASIDAIDPHVQLQLAYSLGESDSRVATRLLANLAIRSYQSSDNYLRDAILSSLTETSIVTFHDVVSENEAAFASFREPILRMAVRAGNRDFLSKLVSRLISQVDSVEPEIASFNALSETLKLARRQGAKTGDATQKAIKELARKLEPLTTNDTLKMQQRVAVIDLVGACRHNDKSFRKRLVDLVAPVEPIEIQTAASRVMADVDPEQLMESFATLSPTVATRTMETLLTRERSSLQLLKAVQAKKIPMQAVNQSSRRKLKAHYSDEVKALASTLFGQSQSTDKQQVLAKYSDVSVLDGDTIKGQAIFQKQCSACHQTKGIGHAVGPDLTAIKNRSPKAMLTAILNPNAAVEDKFRSYNVLTSDGVALTGMISNESSNSITLLMQEGKTKTILRDEIELLKSTGVSLMPEELEKVVSPSDMSHLLAYLNELGPTPRSFDGNEPSIVAPKDGSFSLTASDCRIYGKQIVYEKTHSNIGHWANSDDHIEWTLSGIRPGEYEVWLDYACPHHAAGNEFLLTCGNENATGKIESTGTWDDYKQAKFGTIRLSKPSAIISFKSNGDIRKYLLDLRAVTLKPK